MALVDRAHNKIIVRFIYQIKINIYFYKLTNKIFLVNMPKKIGNILNSLELNKTKICLITKLKFMLGKL